MSGKEMAVILIVWTVLGAALGFLAWLFPSPSKYPVERIAGGIVGAQLFGWAVLLFVHPPWPLTVAFIAAIAGGFCLPYSCRQKQSLASPPTPADSS